MTRQEREELNALSKEVFGSSSRWYKMVTNGIVEPYEQKREVMVPTIRGFEKKTFVDHKGVTKHFSVEEIKKLMQDLIQARNVPPAPNAVTTQLEVPEAEYGTYEQK